MRALGRSVPRGPWGTLAALGAAALLALGAASCGDDDDATPTTSDTAAREGSAGAGAERGAGERGGQGPARADGPRRDGAHGSPPTHTDSGGGAEQFRTPGGDNSIQEFGAEADEEDFEQVAAAMHAYLDARAAGSWQLACRHMAASLVQSLEQFTRPSAPEVGCPELLQALSAAIPKSLRRRAAIADVGSVRVEGDEAFVLYFGAEGEKYLMPMEREDGDWKAAAVTGSRLY